MGSTQISQTGSRLAVGVLVGGLLGACGADPPLDLVTTTRGAATAVPALTPIGGVDMVTPDPAVNGPRPRALAPVSAAAPLGARRVAVLMVDFGTPGTVTAASLAAQAFTNPDSASALLSESSFGKISLTGDVFGWYAIPPQTACDLGAISSGARAAATAAGVNLDAYDHIAYFVSPGFAPGCEASAWGEVGLPATPARQTWYNNGWGTYLVAHEVGHNLGFQHAHSYACGLAVLASSAQCTFDEYGDLFDPMGISTAQFGAYNKAAQGWTDSCGVATVPGRALFNVLPIESTAAGVHAVRVPMDPSLCPSWLPAPCYYYIEYRQPIGVFDGGPNYATSPVMQGALVRAAGPIDVTGATMLQPTGLLDMTPMRSGDTFANFQDARLATGLTFTDPANVRIAVQSASSTGARIAVEVPNGRGLPTCLDNSALQPDALCSNGVRDHGETGVDCGGPCAPCNPGVACSVALDCWSRVCSGGVCQPPPPTCTDAIKNGGETDVDCGGSTTCSRCGDGLACTAGSDCASGLCANGLCMDAQLKVQIRLYSDWATGFCGDITLTNTGTTSITDWKLGIRFADSQFTSTWNAVYTPGAGSIDNVTPVDWNHGIWPSSSTAAGFCANKTGPNYRPQLITVIAQH